MVRSMAEAGSVAVVMPAFNEEAIGTFIDEIDRCLAPLVTHHAFVVLDDASRLPLAEVLPACGPSGAPIQVLRNERNLGHGPSALRAYRAGLALGADIVIHVDGDGQFFGADFLKLVDALACGDAVVGIRDQRSDPWFRRVLSRAARRIVGPGVADYQDVNSPLRLYRRDALQRLVSAVAVDALAPHLQFAVLEPRLGLDVRDVVVRHRPRRGTTSVGTSWQGGRRPAGLPSRRLLWFSLRVFLELSALVLAPSRPHRNVRVGAGETVS